MYGGSEVYELLIECSLNPSPFPWQCKKETIDKSSSFLGQSLNPQPEGEMPIFLRNTGTVMSLLLSDLTMFIEVGRAAKLSPINDLPPTAINCSILLKTRTSFTKTKLSDSFYFSYFPLETG